MGTDSSGHCQAAALMDRFQQLIVNKRKSFRAAAGSEALMRRHHRESGFEYVSWPDLLITFLITFVTTEFLAWCCFAQAFRQPCWLHKPAPWPLLQVTVLSLLPGWRYWWTVQKGQTMTHLKRHFSPLNVPVSLTAPDSCSAKWISWQRLTVST